MQSISSNNKVTPDQTWAVEGCDSLLRPQGALQLIFDTIKDFAIIIISPEGLITSWNTGVERIFGYEESEFVGQPFSMIFIPEDRVGGVPNRELAKALSTGMAIDERWHLKKNEDRFFASGTVRPILQNGETTGFIKVVQDLTERQLEKEALTTAKKDAESANTTKENFISVVSHELRSPLSAILTAVEVIESSGVDTQNVEFVEMIKRSALTEARMVDDLLDATKINHRKLSLRLERVEAHQDIAEIVNDIQKEASAKFIRISVHPDATEQTLRADPTRFRQVIRNLLANAIKFTPDGGGVTLTTSNAGAPANGTHDGNGSIRIVIEDTGLGMSPETIKRLFTPFEQGTPEMKHRFGGLGLGLVITKALVEQHGGSIKVESPGPGLGSKFTVLWPLEVEEVHSNGAPLTKRIEPERVPRVGSKQP